MLRAAGGRPRRAVPPVGLLLPLLHCATLLRLRLASPAVLSLSLRCLPLCLSGSPSSALPPSPACCSAASTTPPTLRSVPSSSASPSTRSCSARCAYRPLGLATHVLHELVGRQHGRTWAACFSPPACLCASSALTMPHLLTLLCLLCLFCLSCAAGRVWQLRGAVRSGVGPPRDQRHGHDQPHRPLLGAGHAEVQVGILSWFLCFCQWRHALVACVVQSVVCVLATQTGA